jgi:hypothetical protein
MPKNAKKVSDKQAAIIHNWLGDVYNEAAKSNEPLWAMTDKLIELFGAEACAAAVKRIKKQK